MKTQKTQLQAYLDSMHWEETTFSSYELEIKITAAMLRYEGSITALDFVLGLARAIRLKQEKEAMSRELNAAIMILLCLEERLENEKIYLTDTDTINNFVRIARYITANNIA